MGKRWLSDYEIDKVFNIVNEVYDNTIGFVCKPTHILYSSSGLHEKIQSILKKGIKVSRIIVALNVDRNADGTCFVSDGKRDGTH